MGVRGFVPSTWLVFSVDPSAQPGGGWVDDLSYRAETLWFWQRGIFAERECTFTDDDLASTLLTRERWPKYASYRVELTTLPGMGSAVDWTQLTASLPGRPDKFMAIDLPKEGVICCFGAGSPIPFRTDLHASEGAAEFEVEYRVRGVPWALRHKRVRVTFIPVEDIAECIQPLRGEALDLAVRDGVRVHLIPHGVVLRVEGQTFWSDPTRAFGVRHELLRNGRFVAVAHAPVCYDPVSTVIPDEHWKALAIPQADPDGPLLFAPEHVGQWSIRILGDVQQSLLNVRAGCYWAGEVELPLAEVLKNAQP